jgi:WD40 repeat protein
MSFVAFSPDGTMVASDGPTNPRDSAGGLSIWGFPDGGLIRSFPLRPQTISDDWKYFTSENSVIEMATGNPVASLKANERRRDSAFSQDSQYLAVSRDTSDKSVGRIQIFRPGDGTLVAEFGRRTTFSLAFHPLGSMLASGHWDNVTLWNFLTGEQLELLRGFGRYVTGISFSPDGRLLAAGTDFGGLQLWDLEMHQKLHAIDLQGGEVSRPAFNPEGTLVAVGVYGTGTVFVIDVATGMILDKARVSGLGCGSVAFSPDGQHLTTPSTGGLITWPHDRGGTIRVFEVRPH